MKFGAHAPFGLLAFSGKPSPAKLIYDDMIRGLGGVDGDLAPVKGTYLEAKCFATSIRSALARKHLIKARDQAFPDSIDTLIANREYEYGAAPPANANIVARREELARRMEPPVAATQANITTELTELLGDDFIQFRTTPQAEAVVNPATVGAAPANLQRPEVPRKIVALGGAVSFVGVAVTVAYEMIATPTAGDSVAELGLVAGDVLVFEPGKSVADRVTVTSVGDGVFTATFSKAHDADARGYTSPLPSQCSTKRHSLVVLTDAAAADPEKRRIVDDHLARRLRATSTWSITGGTLSSTTEFSFPNGLIYAATLSAIAL